MNGNVWYWNVASSFSRDQKTSKKQPEPVSTYFILERALLNFFLLLVTLRIMGMSTYYGDELCITDMSQAVLSHHITIGSVQMHK